MLVYSFFVSIFPLFLLRHPHFTVYTSLKDSGLYLFSHLLLSILNSHPSIYSISNDLIPFLVRKQYDLKMNLNSMKEIQKEEFLIKQMSHSKGNWNNNNTNNIPNMNISNVNNNPINTTTNTSESSPSIRIFLYQLSELNFCMRSNTFLNYKNLNHEFALDKEYSYMPWNSISFFNQIEKIILLEKTKIGQYVLTAENLKIGENCMIKKSILGKGGIVGNKNNITGCIIGDHVNIEEKLVKCS